MVSSMYKCPPCLFCIMADTILHLVLKFLYFHANAIDYIINKKCLFCSVCFSQETTWLSFLFFSPFQNCRNFAGIKSFLFQRRCRQRGRQKAVTNLFAIQFVFLHFFLCSIILCLSFLIYCTSRKNNVCLVLALFLQQPSEKLDINLKVPGTILTCYHRRHCPYFRLKRGKIIFFSDNLTPNF